MINWLERLKGDSQGQLLSLLRRSHQTITSLAERLRLSDNAVRTHVAALERDGLVEPAGTVRDTGGKPARLYGLSREGEELFPKAYAFVLEGLIEEIILREGRDKAVGLLEAVGRRAGSGVAESADLETRVQAAAQALRKLGGDVEVIPREQDWLLQGYGCPLSQVTSSHADACALAQALVTEITGRPAVECCDRSGRPRCRFEVPFV
jgi:predicted ArsR family transcriptional regulator